MYHANGFLQPTSEDTDMSKGILLMHRCVLVGTYLTYAGAHRSQNHDRQPCRVTGFCFPSFSFPFSLLYFSLGGCCWLFFAEAKVYFCDFSLYEKSVSRVCVCVGTLSTESILSCNPFMVIVVLLRLLFPYYLAAVLFSFFCTYYYYYYFSSACTSTWHKWSFWEHDDDPPTNAVLYVLWEIDSCLCVCLYLYVYLPIYRIIVNPFNYFYCRWYFLFLFFYFSMWCWGVAQRRAFLFLHKKDSFRFYLIVPLLFLFRFFLSCDFFFQPWGAKINVLDEAVIRLQKQ